MGLPSPADLRRTAARPWIPRRHRSLVAPVRPAVLHGPVGVPALPVRRPWWLLAARHAALRLGRLLEQMGRLQRQVLNPRGLTLLGLTAREIEVLRLVADGFENREIADKLSYSERTVKNVLHDITTRLQLRNRAHAVAYALRHGLL